MRAGVVVVVALSALVGGCFISPVMTFGAGGDQ